MFGALMATLSKPWPWWVAGPLIGLVATSLLLVDGKVFGVSSTLRHLCAATVPGRSRFLAYDWRRIGSWNLVFALGIVLGGLTAATVLGPTDTPMIAAATQVDLGGLGLEVEGFMPREIYSFDALKHPAGWWILVGGGFLIGFGARWAGGCTSGHAISGLATLQLSSLIAVVGFFAGGLLATHGLLPWILGVGG